MTSPAPIVLPLTSQASLELVGGKGRSLAQLAAAGLPVPDGFLLTTNAYQTFIQANDLQESILRFVDGVLGDQTGSAAVSAAQLASSNIQSLFQSASLPSKIATSIAESYAALGDGNEAVAVRSSATVEDLPDLSVAGQQDSYLNVHGAAELLGAIQNCWASLWTARAIGYRKRMAIDQRTVAMCVIVQIMVDADAAGVIFTANPSTGERSELVVNASFGLGEAVVAGVVTPDTYVVDRQSLNSDPKQTIIGSKQVMVVSTGQRGTTTKTVPAQKRGEPAITVQTLGRLAELSIQVERLFEGLPQDIEWAVDNQQCWLLQSRPITNLPAAPLADVRWDPPAKGDRLIRRQVVENMPEPLCPLFDELYLREGLEHAVDQMTVELKLPFDITAFIDRPMFLTVNGFAYCRANYRWSWRLLWVGPRAVLWYLIAIRGLLRRIVPDWRDVALPKYLALIDHWKQVDAASASDRQLLDGMRALTTADAVYWFRVSMVLGAAKVTDDLLNWYLTSRLVQGDVTSGVFLRGYPSKTLDAQAQLEQIAARIRSSESLRELVTSTPARDLLAALELFTALDDQPAGAGILCDLRQFLEQYGHQVYNLDFVQPTQIEDPVGFLLNLKSLVAHPGCDTSTRQREFAEQRDSAEKQTLASLGPCRRWLFRKLLNWAQTFGPHREQALFYIGAAWPTVRGLAFELGQRLVDAGTLSSADDLFFLETAEINEACCARADDRGRPDLGQRTAQRRELREARKRLFPPGMIPVGSKFTLGPLDLTAFETQKRNDDDSQTLEGFAVSPGTVTAQATVIGSPEEFEKMTPDTILVCTTTTPAWTPLLALACGLVTDIGGVLAHGSIVAREYGIPAVMGTGNATRRIVSGQQITVDGAAGTVTILSPPGEDPPADSGEPITQSDHQ